MQQRRRGPDFERSEEQRVVIGPYEQSRPPESPEPAAPPTLLEKLRARITGRGKSGSRGPGFVQPDGAKRVGRFPRARRDRSEKLPRTRPAGFTDPTPPTAQ